MYSAILVLPETFDNRGNDILVVFFYIAYDNFRWKNLVVILTLVPWMKWNMLTMCYYEWSAMVEARPYHMFVNQISVDVALLYQESR
jgi:hypothetical protein